MEYFSKDQKTIKKIKDEMFTKRGFFRENNKTWSISRTILYFNNFWDNRRIKNKGFYFLGAKLGFFPRTKINF